MRIQCDTLRYTQLMNEKGVEFATTNGFMSTLPEIEIFNIHSKSEVDGMLSEAVKAVIAEQRREFDARMQERAQQHEQQRLDSRNEARAARRENRNELLVSRRWTIGTIITVGFSLAAYLSALIHFNH